MLTWICISPVHTTLVNFPFLGLLLGQEEPLHSHIDLPLELPKGESKMLNAYIFSITFTYSFIRMNYVYCFQFYLKRKLKNII